MLAIGICLGALVSSAWLLLATALDLLADQPPGARRLWWLLGVVGFAFLAPALILGAQGAQP